MFYFRYLFVIYFSLSVFALSVELNSSNFADYFSDQDTLYRVNIYSAYEKISEEYGEGYIENEVDHKQKEINKKILIKIKGNISRTFAKKQYSIKFINERNQKIQESFIGLPQGEKFSLHGPFVDRSLMRNKLIYEIAREMGKSRGNSWFAPRSHFILLSINGQEQGLYLVVEKIERGNTRVNIKKNKFDKNNKVSFIGEISYRHRLFPGDHNDKTNKFKTKFKYAYPSENTLLQMLNNDSTRENAELFIDSIHRTLDDLESNLKNQNFDKVYEQIDVNSFVDFFIISEVFKNIDSYKRSAFFYKNKNGKIFMGPIWDQDLAAGNLNLFSIGKTHGFIHSNKIIKLISGRSKWFKYLLKDQNFKILIHTRYEELRKPGYPLHLNSIKNKIKKYQDLLGEAARLDRDLWLNKQTLEQKYLLSHKNKGKTFYNDVSYMHSWLIKRLHWLDINMGKSLY